MATGKEAREGAKRSAWSLSKLNDVVRGHKNHSSAADDMPPPHRNQTSMRVSTFLLSWENNIHFVLKYIITSFQ